MKTLLLDIETSPNLAYVWGVWQQDVRLDQMVTSSTTLCWAAKWLGRREVMFDSVHESKPQVMLKRIHQLLDEADAVVTYNGKKFDVPTLNKEFLLHGFNPPSPYKHVDLLQVARSSFRFQSNKLDYVSQQMGFAGKTKHEGFKLWVKCMAGDQKAWAQMKKYNKNDVTELERVYMRMRPWIHSHPNVGLHDGVDGCPRCGSDKYQARGSARTAQASYQRYQCTGCGGWFRGKSKHEKTPFSAIH